MDLETYVQRYYLEKILYAANRRFADMSAGQFELRMVDEENAGKGKNRGLDLMVYSNVTGKEREVRTLSGGESLLQPDFASALFQAAKAAGINTALESTGFADFEVIKEKILPWLDLYLMDIKHISSAKHKLFTGQPNERILANARKIAESGQKLIIRVPVIPTFNDTPAEILEIAQFARSLPGVEQLHLLPYHRLGQDKYAGLGREYLMSHIEPPANEHMEMLREVAATTGLHVQIGG